MNEVVIETKSGMDQEVDQVMAAARDALSDEMIGRLSATAGEAMDLVDQVQRSGLAKAIPTLAKLVQDGDLERLAQLVRVYTSAQDALSDEMVSRLSESIGGGLALIDQVQRAGLERAIPALVQLVDNGDLQRLVRLARVYSSAEDALSEEMIGRIADMMGNGLSLLDRVTRGGGERIVGMLERLEHTGALERLATTLPLLVDRLEMVHSLLMCISDAATISQQSPPSGGGVGGLWRVVKDPESQDTLRFLMLLGKKLRTTCHTNVA